MKNFLRALRFAWPYRGRLCFSILCALMAAVLWSLTFTAIYPVQKLLGTEKNLQEYIDDSIRSTNMEVDKWQTMIDSLSREKRTYEGWEKGTERNNRLRRIDSDLARTESRLEAARRLLSTTAAPNTASPRAIASPMPRLAPVPRATLP